MTARWSLTALLLFLAPCAPVAAADSSVGAEILAPLVFKDNKFFRRIQEAVMPAALQSNLVTLENSE